MITVTVNDKQISVSEGTTVAAAILIAGVDAFRRSVKDSARGPLCGMGICFECRVTIGGISHQRSCTTIVVEGMEIKTDG